MESLGTEVGQKMRSAVKAKLIELGTGSSSGGYIDDELPDYVMIMVANKRSKKQMRDDLQLFLNENTEPFVNWLHQVLDKLQEVTLPANVAQKASGKSASSSGADSKKDKKSKKTKRSAKDQTPPKAVHNTGSITDVFADQLIGKAKKSLDIEKQAPVKKQESRKEVPVMPSVTDLVKQAVVTSKRKELEELEQIQKQIEEAKRQLKIIPGEPIEEPAKQPEQDEDDDFLNLKADELEDEDNAFSEKEVSQPPPTNTRRNRSPIVFDRPKARRNSERNANEELKSSAAAKEPPSTTKRDNIISLSEHRQLERELYTPVHRRKSEAAGGQSTLSSSSHRPARHSDHSDRDSRQRHRQPDHRDRRMDDRDRHIRSRSPPVHRRDRTLTPPREVRKPFRERERERDRLVSTAAKPLASRVTRIEVTRSLVEDADEELPIKERLPVRQRIGSRVIVAPPKVIEDEEEVDVPVSSIVTVKPRPKVEKSRQANKNLLLRACADAQKSIVGHSKPGEVSLIAAAATATTKAPLSVRLAQKAVAGIKGRLGDIATKRQRSQINAIVSSLDPVLKRQKPNEKIIIEIGPNGEDSDSDGLMDGDDDEEDAEDLNGNGNGLHAEPEYVPQHVDALKRSQKILGAELLAEAEDEQREEVLASLKPEGNTQFVVTLDGAFNKAVPPGLRKRIGAPAEAKKQQEEKKGFESAVRSNRSTSSRVPARSGMQREETARTPERTGRVADLRQKVEEKKRNGSPMNAKSPTSVANRKRRSPIKFSDERRDEKDGDKPAEPGATDVPQRKRIRITDSPKREESRREKEPTRNGNEIKSNIVVVSKEKEKRDPKKYDNIPSLLSSVAVPTAGSTIGKVLERCKFYPNCTRGDSCEFVHPSTPCKVFPLCKFGESCLYIHPKCKFDLACVRADCPYSHTPVSTATPLSSHVVPVQNYKSISANPLPAICRFFPNCTNGGCTFFHPKMCFYGPNCPNKLECNFYHHEMPSARFKWVSPMSG